MKISSLQLAGSIAVNLALGFIVGGRRGYWPAPFSGSNQTALQAGASVAVASHGPAFSPDHPDPQLWSDLSQGDLASIAARLHAGGFPASLQRAILSALVAEHFAARHHAIAELIAHQPWWQGTFNIAPVGTKVMAERQALQREEKEMLDQLLGADSARTEYARAKQARSFGDLPPEKAVELGRLLNDYNDLAASVRTSAQNILLPEDRTQLALLEKEKRADIEKLLSPEELFEYDLRSSPTALQLRNTLAAFDPTDDEFRAIFKVQFPFDTKYGSPDLMTPDQLRQRRAEQADVTNAVQAVLSPDRFADYKLKTDNAYLQVNALVTRLQLPPTTTADVVAVQKDILARATAVSKNAALSPADRNQQWVTLGSEAITRLTTTLGENGLAAFRQTGTGAWINTLQHPPAPAPAPSTPASKP